MFSMPVGIIVEAVQSKINEVKVTQADPSTLNHMLAASTTQGNGLQKSKSLTAQFSSMRTVRRSLVGFASPPRKSKALPRKSNAPRQSHYPPHWGMPHLDETRVSTVSNNGRRTSEVEMSAIPHGQVML